MTLEYIKKLNKIAEKIREEHMDLFTKKGNNWYSKRKVFLEENEKFLNLVSIELKKENEKLNNPKELFYMQKLFLEYPQSPPNKLLSLQKEQINCILDLYSKEKRNFYIEICYANDIDIKTLKEWILNDLYEKIIGLLEEMPSKEDAKKSDFLDKVLEILPMIWQ